MKNQINLKILLNLFLVISPFLTIIIINESARISAKQKSTAKGLINTKETKLKQCTWKCHDNTKSFCIPTHQKNDNNFFYTKYNKDLFFSVIDMLKLNSGKTALGNKVYRLANLAILLIIIPFLILYFLIRSINMQIEINNFKKVKDAID
jgi:hypothetical protein